MDFDITTNIGILGAALILFAFVMNQTHRWKDTDLVYDVANLLGGALLVLYAFLIGSIPFMVLNGVWTLVSLRDVVYRKNHQ